MMRERVLNPLLWLGFLAGPLAWALQLQVNYMLTPSACEAKQEWWLHLVSLSALLLAGLGALTGWRSWRRLGPGSQEKGDMRSSRARFMALGGVVLSLFFALVIVALEIPNLILVVCD